MKKTTIYIIIASVLIAAAVAGVIIWRKVKEKKRKEAVEGVKVEKERAFQTETKELLNYVDPTTMDQQAPETEEEAEITAVEVAAPALVDKQAKGDDFAAVVGSDQPATTKGSNY